MSLMNKDEKRYWWKFEIILKSGEKIEAYDKNHFDNSYDLATEYLKGGDDTFISLGNTSNTKNILIRTDEIAVMTISAR